jgi:hypothetical protein
VSNAGREFLTAHLLSDIAAEAIELLDEELLDLIVASQPQ